jgi:hypothetical protein
MGMIVMPLIMVKTGTTQLSAICATWTEGQSAPTACPKAVEKSCGDGNGVVIIGGGRGIGWETQVGGKGTVSNNRQRHAHYMCLLNPPACPTTRAHAARLRAPHTYTDTHTHLHIHTQTRTMYKKEKEKNHTTRQASGLYPQVV